MDRLCRKSLEHFNEIHSLKYEFVRFIKANHHVSAGMMYFITFEGKLLSDDDDSKQFQAKLCYCAGTPEIISCELKPQRKGKLDAWSIFVFFSVDFSLILVIKFCSDLFLAVHSIEAPEKEDPKKPRFIYILSLLL